MGKDSVVPFLSTEGTCAFVLARTSNPGGNDFQLLKCDDQRLFERVADQVGTWSFDTPGEGGLVVGATDIDDMTTLRERHPDMPFLIPGVGAQGGSAEDVMQAAGSGPVLVNSSRAILYASDGPDFAEKAAQAADKNTNYTRIMIRRIVNLHIANDHIDDFLVLFEGSKAAILSMDGCLELRLLQQIDDPSRFTHLQFLEKVTSICRDYRASDLFPFHVGAHQGDVFRTRPGLQPSKNCIAADLIEAVNYYPVPSAG